MRQAYRSAKGPKLEPPVARQVAAVGHATPFSVACLAPFGLARHAAAPAGAWIAATQNAPADKLATPITAHATTPTHTDSTVRPSADEHGSVVRASRRRQPFAREPDSRGPLRRKPVEREPVGLDLSAANLTGVDLTGANLDLTTLRQTNMTKANLSGATLSDADMTDSNLTNANLKGADLSGTLVTGITWSNTTCPDGTRSDTNGTAPQTCKGHGGGL